MFRRRGIARKTVSNWAWISTTLTRGGTKARTDSPRAAVIAWVPDVPGIEGVLSFLFQNQGTRYSERTGSNQAFGRRGADLRMSS